MGTVTAPSFLFESQVIFYVQNAMVECGAPVLLSVNHIQCRNELERQELCEMNCG